MLKCNFLQTCKFLLVFYNFRLNFSEIVISIKKNG